MIFQPRPLHWPLSCTSNPAGQCNGTTWKINDRRRKSMLIIPQSLLPFAPRPGCKTHFPPATPFSQTPRWRASVSTCARPPGPVPGLGRGRERTGAGPDPGSRRAAAGAGAAGTGRLAAPRARPVDHRLLAYQVTCAPVPDRASARARQRQKHEDLHRDKPVPALNEVTRTWTYLPSVLRRAARLSTEFYSSSTAGDQQIWPPRSPGLWLTCMRSSMNSAPRNWP